MVEWQVHLGVSQAENDARRSVLAPARPKAAPPAKGKGFYEHGSAIHIEDQAALWLARMDGD